jgi:hypothetical protein
MSVWRISGLVLTGKRDVCVFREEACPIAILSAKKPTLKCGIEPEPSPIAMGFVLEVALGQVFIPVLHYFFLRNLLIVQNLRYL